MNRPPGHKNEESISFLSGSPRSSVWGVLLKTLFIYLLLGFATSHTKKHCLGNTWCFTRLEEWWGMRNQTENFLVLLWDTLPSPSSLAHSSLMKSGNQKKKNSRDTNSQRGRTLSCQLLFYVVFKTFSTFAWQPSGVICTFIIQVGGDKGRSEEVGGP